MSSRFPSIAVVVLWGAAAWAAAQEPPVSAVVPEPPTFQIPPGAKVRLASTALPGGFVVGRVTSSTDDALGVTVAGDDSPFMGAPIVIPRASVTSAQVSLGRHSYWKMGALFGAIAGAGAGAAATIDPATCDSYSSDTFCSRGEAIGISAVAGALLGGLVGAVIKTEKWQKVSVEVLAPRSSAGRAAPRGRGGAVAAQIAVRF